MNQYPQLVKVTALSKITVIRFIKSDELFMTILSIGTLIIELEENVFLMHR
ncbi:hypothetical protein ADIARSV_1225 [Arcticibacter svalbardensis MN12-7]|uniref:Uncharacterized protein n=1 Tax=Arcticibacter svalbardensis MN12-7 TaxID=1150600 RepID=R9H362_9SPHI|nr:hypothetical protein ADIARSV_1225 [Arcticibacter svalbardensis MN12-7]